MSRRVRRERASTSELVGLKERANCLVTHLFGQDARRRNCARTDPLAAGAVSRRADIGLDPQSLAWWDMIERKLRTETSLTISLTTYARGGRNPGDRIAIVDGSKIIALGSPAELKTMVKGVVSSSESRVTSKALAVIREQPRCSRRVG